MGCPMHLNPIASTQNPHIKALARLAARPAERRARGQLLLEGIHLLDAALNHGLTVAEVLVQSRVLAHPEVRALLARLPDGCCGHEVSETVMARLSSLDTPPELAAVISTPPAAAPETGDSLLLLDAVQDPGNLGAILRTAAAAGIRQAWLSPPCADPWSAKVLRAGMGAHFAVALHTDADLVAVLEDFSGPAIVTSLDATQSLYALDLRQPCAFVFGNEGAGVSAGVLARASHPVRIPMPGMAESLNVAAAVAVCLFEQVRQRLPM